MEKSQNTLVSNKLKKSVTGDICLCIADSLCYTAETNTPL